VTGVGLRRWKGWLDVEERMKASAAIYVCAKCIIYLISCSERSGRDW